MSDRQIADILEEIRKRSAVTPVLVADRLSWAEFSSIALNAPALPGVTPEAGLSRSYPRAGDFAHVLGYVGPVSDYDLSKIENPDRCCACPSSSWARSAWRRSWRNLCAARPVRAGSR